VRRPEPERARLRPLLLERRPDGHEPSGEELRLEGQELLVDEAPEALQDLVHRLAPCESHALEPTRSARARAIAADLISSALVAESDPTSGELSRHERLRGVVVARTILRDAFKLELTLVDGRGPLAHQRGGVMVGSSEVCRTA